MKGRILTGVVVAFVVILTAVLSFSLGVRHAIYNLEMCIVEFDDPDVIEKGFDVRIWIDLDGHTYEHYGYIG